MRLKRENREKIKKRKNKEGSHQEFVSAFFPSPPQREERGFANSVDSCHSLVLLEAAHQTAVVYIFTADTFYFGFVFNVICF